MKIYGVPISVHTRKAIVAAREKKIAFDVEPVIPFDPPTNWDALSPTGKIPVMTDGDLTLADSSVICTYLDHKYPQPPLYPQDIVEQAHTLWFEEYCDGTLYREVVHGLFFQNVIRPGMLGQPTDTEIVRTILQQAAPKAFGYLEGSLRGEHLAARQFTIADLALTSNLINFHYLGYAIDAARFPKLAAHFRTHLRRPSIVKALDAEKPFAAGMKLHTAFLDENAAASV